MPQWFVLLVLLSVTTGESPAPKPSLTRRSDAHGRHSVADATSAVALSHLQDAPKAPMRAVRSSALRGGGPAFELPSSVAMVIGAAGIFLDIGGTGSSVSGMKSVATKFRHFAGALLCARARVCARLGAFVRLWRVRA